MDLSHSEGQVLRAVGNLEFILSSHTAVLGTQGKQH